MKKYIRWFFLYTKMQNMKKKSSKTIFSSIIITIFAVAFSCRKPIGLCGRVWLLWNRAFTNVRLRLLVNFATLPIVGRRCDNGECSRWVYCILLRIVVYILWYNVVCYMVVYSWKESSYTITWAFCIVRLFQLRAMRRPSSSGMGKKNPTFPFYRGLTEY